LLFERQQETEICGNCCHWAKAFGSATTDAKQIGKASWERQKKIDYHYDPRPMP